jgi:hypothetical protein
MSAPEPSRGAGRLGPGFSTHPKSKVEMDVPGLRHDRLGKFNESGFSDSQPLEAKHAS